jgi:hypothetical protein
MYSEINFDLIAQESQFKKAEPSYRNIMEELVDLEVKRQIKKLPSTIQNYIDPLEVSTYALNRLPPLYASSEKGKIAQEKYAKSKLRETIVNIVNQSINIIEEDPQRNVIPLIEEKDANYETSCLALKDLENYLQQNNLLYSGSLTWENLLDTIKYALENISYLETTKIHKQELINRFKKWSERSS